MFVCEGAIDRKSANSSGSVNRLFGKFSFDQTKLFRISSTSSEFRHFSLATAASGGPSATGWRRTTRRSRTRRNSTGSETSAPTRPPLFGTAPGGDRSESWSSAADSVDCWAGSEFEARSEAGEKSCGGQLTVAASGGSKAIPDKSFAET